MARLRGATASLASMRVDTTERHRASCSTIQGCVAVGMAWLRVSAAWRHTPAASFGSMRGTTTDRHCTSNSRAFRSVDRVMARQSVAVASPASFGPNRATTAERLWANGTRTAEFVGLFIAWQSVATACPHTAAPEAGSLRAASADKACANSPRDRASVVAVMASVRTRITLLTRAESWISNWANINATWSRCSGLVPKRLEAAPPSACSTRARRSSSEADGSLQGIARMVLQLPRRHRPSQCLLDETITQVLLRGRSQLPQRVDFRISQRERLTGLGLEGERTEQTAGHARHQPVVGLFQILAGGHRSRLVVLRVTLSLASLQRHPGSCSLRREGQRGTPTMRLEPVRRRFPW